MEISILRKPRRYLLPRYLPKANVQTLFLSEANKARICIYYFADNEVTGNVLPSELTYLRVKTMTLLHGWKKVCNLTFPVGKKYFSS